MTQIEKLRFTARQTDGQTNIYTERKTDGQTHRRTERQPGWG